VLFYDARWFDTGGYAFLHRDVPLFAFDHRQARPGLIHSTTSFNAVVLKRSSTPDFAGRFQMQQCFASPDSEDMCIMVRPGPCTHDLEMDELRPPNEF
jgi:hypothetical protein